VSTVDNVASASHENDEKQNKRRNSTVSCQKKIIPTPNDPRAPLKTHVRTYLSSFRDWLTSIIRDPANNCITKPEVMMGEMPNSISVPLQWGERGRRENGGRS
jgi:hypothetical protein